MSIENIARAEHMAKFDVVQRAEQPRDGVIAKILERGYADGVFTREVDPIDLHMMISAFCVFRVANRYTFRTIFDRDLTDDVAARPVSPDARRHGRRLSDERLRNRHQAGASRSAGARLLHEIARTGAACAPDPGSTPGEEPKRLDRLEDRHSATVQRPAAGCLRLPEELRLERHVDDLGDPKVRYGADRGRSPSLDEPPCPSGSRGRRPHASFNRSPSYLETAQRGHVAFREAGG